MKICKISLISLIAVFSINMPVDARVNVKSNNRGNIDAYNQVAAMRNQQAQTAALTTASDVGDLPVSVEDKKLAESILNNSSENVTISDLEACSMIYPSGIFKWAVPESGIRLNKTAQCVAVVELRDANSNAVLATTTLAAGDMMKCNIDMFPRNGWLPALEKVELPADAAPTLEQVEAVMNEEQKQNAGVKIAAGAILAGVAGNLLAPKEAGDNKLFGTGKTQLADTAIGAVAGAGIMAASTYSGKVAGDTIKSTAVNAASGMVVGNMMAGASGGDSVLATTKCTVNKVEHDCIVGNLTKKSGEDFATKYSGKNVYIHYENGNMFECEKPSDSDKTVCIPIYGLIDVEIESQAQNTIKYKALRSPSYIKNLDKNYTENVQNAQKYVRDDSLDDIFVKKGDGGNDTGDNYYYHVVNAVVTDGTKVHAYAVCDSLPSKQFGSIGYEWEDIESYCRQYYYRNSSGTVGSLIYKAESNSTDAEYEFEPTSRDATDGGLVDLSNAARAKATITGTAAGGALGGFAGYQGAKSEVTERWLAEQRNYEGSLSNFYCATGTRFLSQYNSYAEIPNYTKSEE